LRSLHGVDRELFLWTLPPYPPFDPCDLLPDVLHTLDVLLVRSRQREVLVDSLQLALKHLLSQLHLHLLPHQHPLRQQLQQFQLIGTHMGLDLTTLNMQRHVLHSLSSTIIPSIIYIQPPCRLPYPCFRQKQKNFFI